jgi:hypothetical protein
VLSVARLGEIQMIRKVFYSRPGLILASLFAVFLLAVLASIARSGEHAKAEPAITPAPAAKNSATPTDVLVRFPERGLSVGIMFERCHRNRHQGGISS